MKASELGHIITHYVNQKGEDVSHKKLQKLVYYVEAWHLVHLNSSIVDEDFEAWIHGPVVPELYRELKDFGFNNIDVINDEFDTIDEELKAIIKRNGITDEQMELIHSVLDKYANLSAFELEILSHNEKPWLDAREGLSPNNPSKNRIDKGSMKSFYYSLN